MFLPFVRLGFFGLCYDPTIITIKGNGLIFTYHYMKIKKEFLSHTTSFVASDAAIYLAFVMESATHVCLTLLQQMAPPFKVNTQLDVDLLESMSP